MIIYETGYHKRITSISTLIIVIDCVFVCKDVSVAAKSNTSVQNKLNKKALPSKNKLQRLNLQDHQPRLNSNVIAIVTKQLFCCRKQEKI